MITPQEAKDWIYNLDRQRHYAVVKFTEPSGRASFELVCGISLRYHPKPAEALLEIAKSRNANSFEFVVIGVSNEDAQKWIASRTDLSLT